MSLDREALVKELEQIAASDGSTLVLDPSEAVEIIAMLEPREPGFEGWADVELMGHRQRVAYVKPIEIAHRGFLELTWTVGEQHCREIYSPSAVFCLTPLEEEQARALLSPYVPNGNDEIPF